MADITWDNVVNLVPELSTLDADAQTDILAWANTALVVAHFGGEASAKLKLTRIYLALHLGTTIAKAIESGALGTVTSESADGLSRSYGGVIAEAGNDLGSTEWGRLARGMMRSSAARAPMVL